MKYDNFSNEKGDFFFLNNIYNKYRQLKANVNEYKNKNTYKFSLNKQIMDKWMKESFLNFRALVQTEDLVE